MHHSHAYSDIVSYVLWGGGAWSNRWSCTGHDWVLATVSILGCLWMLFEGARYAWRAGHPAGGEVSDHNRQLRYVFAQLAVINAVSMILVWIVPAYYLIAVLCWLNAYQTGRLNRAKLDELLEKELSDGRVAMARMAKLRSAFGTEVVEETIDHAVSSEDLVNRIQATLGEARGLASELRRTPHSVAGG